MTDLSRQLSEGDLLEEGDLGLALETVLATPHGRTVLRWVLGECKIYGAIFAGEGPTTDFNLGARNVGLKLIAKLDELGPTLYPQLLLEAAQRKPRQEPVDVVDQPEPGSEPEDEAPGGDD